MILSMAAAAAKNFGGQDIQKRKKENPYEEPLDYVGESANVGLVIIGHIIDSRIMRGESRNRT